MTGIWTRKETPNFSKKGRLSLYFDIVAQFWAGGPDEVRAAPLNRICTLARKMGVKNVIAEDALHRKDVIAEIERLENALATSGDVTAACITFLGARGKKEPDGRVIGQIVVITFPTQDGPKSYVFEAIIRIPTSDGAAPLLNNYVMERVSFPVTVKGTEHHIPGAYFCQPNGVTTSEVEAAIRATVMSIGGKGSERAKRVPRSFASAPEALVEALRDANCTATIYSSERASPSVLDQDIWTVICSHIESGNPVLLVLAQPGMPDRILPVIGYTLNTDEWHPGGSSTMRQPDAHWFSSSQWVDHLVVQDPALGPYFCLSRAWLAASLASHDENGLKPSFMIATVPREEITVSPVVAEEIAGRYLKAWLRFLADEGTGKGRWWDYLVKSENFIVLRTTLISRADYRHHLQQLDEMARKKSLANSTHEESTVIDDFIDSLPEDVWMCEISLPQLYVGNRTKLGEVLIAPGVRDADRSFLGSRLPSQIFWRDERGEFFVAPTGIDFHAPLLAAAEHGNRW